MQIFYICCYVVLFSILWLAGMEYLVIYMIKLSIFFTLFHFLVVLVKRAIHAYKRRTKNKYTRGIF